MSSLETVINVSGHDRDVIGVTSLDPEQAELCARLVARHARDAADGDLIADVLGLDEGARTWNIDYGRIMHIADSSAAQARTGTTCTGCGYKRTSQNHRTLCGDAA